MSLIPARSHNFVEIDHEIISVVILVKGCGQFDLIFKVTVRRTLKSKPKLTCVLISLDERPPYTGFEGGRVVRGRV